METYRLKNIAILILLLLNAFLLMLLGYQYMQSQQSDVDTAAQLRVLFESNQLTLSESVDPLQPTLTPMALSRSTGTEADMAAALLGGEAVGASQGGGIYSYIAAAGSLQFRAGGSFDSTQLSRRVEDIAALARRWAAFDREENPSLTEGEERLCEAAPCALSRSEHTSAPTPPSLSAAWPEALCRLTLYTRPELAFRLGDRVEVTDEGGSVWMGRTSDSFRYDSHCVTVVEISGVEPSAGDAEGVCGGQVSRETGKEG